MEFLIIAVVLGQIVNQGLLSRGMYFYPLATAVYVGFGVVEGWLAVDVNWSIGLFLLNDLAGAWAGVIGWYRFGWKPVKVRRFSEKRVDLPQET